VKRNCALFVFLLLHLWIFADKGESSRILVHTLNYLGQDYQYAVDNGKVISAAEYKEMQDFAKTAVRYFHEFSVEWSDSDSAAIGMLIYRVDSLIDRKAPAIRVAAAAVGAKDKILAATGLVITPSKYPSIESGKVIYKTHCEKCHGAGGYGDGPEGKELDPLPRNFQDNERIKSISPFFAFNAIRLGVEGTGMKPHPQLSDEEVWDVAFYVISLRYQKLSSKPFLKSKQAEMLLDSFSAAKAATSTDEELLASLSLTDTSKGALYLAAIRLHQPVQSGSEFLNTSLKYLQGAMELYNKGKYSEAAQLTALAYLEGIEPIEMQLKASDPGLVLRLEEQMQHLRKMMEQSHSALEVNDSLRALRITISEANDLMGEKEYSFTLAFLLAASVLLREGLEAFLVILVILSILSATHLKNAARWVHAGWLLAVLVGVTMWFAGGHFLQNQMRNIELIEGFVSFAAVGMLLYVGFWLHGKSEAAKWKEYVSKMMKGMVSRESMIGLAGLSFFVVFREVFESVLFLSAMNIESGGKQTEAIASGVIFAFAIVVVFAFLVLRFSTRLPIPQLFKISSFVMGVLAIILTGKGIHSFQEVGKVPIHGFQMIRIELLGIFPTVESIAAQLIVLLVVVVIWNMTLAPKKSKTQGQKDIAR
jgi:high-affinity iron transporter